MTNLFDKIKKPFAKSDIASEIPTSDNLSKGNENQELHAESGADARRAAERKAEEAGQKWRKTAEESGEVPKEIGGPKGLEPTRYGDWEKAGRCYDF